METNTLDHQLSVLVAIVGARMRYAVPIAFGKKNALARYYTDFYFSDQSKSKPLFNAIKKLPFELARRGIQRYDTRLPYSKVTSFDSFGILYTLFLRICRSYKQRGAVNNYFQKSYAKKVAKSNWSGANTVYGINFASKEIFEKARTKKICCILEQCSAPASIMSSIYYEEKERWSDWQDLDFFSIKSQNQREQDEWELADGILCGSKFVMEGLESCGVSKNKCFVVPYAVDTEKFYPSSEKINIEKKNKINVLFVGELDIRKGIQYLYQATKHLDLSRFVFKAAGHVSIKPNAASKLSETLDILGLVPHNKISDLFRWADIFVLPTVSEGSALVTYEALASGVPVITTNNAGSVVSDGINGFIVPIRDAEAIADRLNWLANDREILRTMSLKARNYSIRELSWDTYAERLVKTCQMIQQRNAS